SRRGRDAAPRAGRADGRRCAGEPQGRVPEGAAPVADRRGDLAVAGRARRVPADSGCGVAAPWARRLCAAWRGAASAQAAPAARGRRGDAGGHMMRDPGRGGRWTLVLVAAVTLALTWSGAAAAATKPRAVMVVPFDASALESDERWIGEGIEEILGLG